MVGRHRAFPDGVHLTTLFDFFSVVSMRYSFIVVANQVAEIDSLRYQIFDFISKAKLKHRVQSVRETSAISFTLMCSRFSTNHLSEVLKSLVNEIESVNQQGYLHGTALGCISILDVFRNRNLTPEQCKSFADLAITVLKNCKKCLDKNYGQREIIQDVICRLVESCSFLELNETDMSFIFSLTRSVLLSIQGSHWTAASFAMKELYAFHLSSTILKKEYKKDFNLVSNSSEKTRLLFWLCQVSQILANSGEAEDLRSALLQKTLEAARNPSLLHSDSRRDVILSLGILLDSYPDAIVSPVLADIVKIVEDFAVDYQTDKKGDAGAQLREISMEISYFLVIKYKEKLAENISKDHKTSFLDVIASMLIAGCADRSNIVRARALYLLHRLRFPHLHLDLWQFTWVVLRSSFGILYEVNLSPNPKEADIFCLFSETQSPVQLLPKYHFNLCEDLFKKMHEESIIFFDSLKEESHIVDYWRQDKISDFMEIILETEELKNLIPQHWDKMTMQRKISYTANNRLNTIVRISEFTRTQPVFKALCGSLLSGAISSQDPDVSKILTESLLLNNLAICAGNLNNPELSYFSKTQLERLLEARPELRHVFYFGLLDAFRTAYVSIPKIRWEVLSKYSDWIEILEKVTSNPMYFQVKFRRSLYEPPKSILFREFPSKLNVVSSMATSRDCKLVFLQLVHFLSQTWNKNISVLVASTNLASSICSSEIEKLGVIRKEGFLAQIWETYFAYLFHPFPKIRVEAAEALYEKLLGIADDIEDLSDLQNRLLETSWGHDSSEEWEFAAADLKLFLVGFKGTL
eukprot:GHVP01025848.1.p1 GENE.GHVP01025848.1~~GHVP01025848.1.p1  ORF type:complete len:808 (+),score=135.27 GHVP01025848.1:1680-4103(+)